VVNLLPKLVSPTEKRKNCSSDREKIEAEDQEFAKILRSLEQFIQTVQMLQFSKKGWTKVYPDLSRTVEHQIRLLITSVKPPDIPSRT
jgi:hypothetical protein